MIRIYEPQKPRVGNLLFSNSTVQSYNAQIGSNDSFRVEGETVRPIERVTEVQNGARKYTLLKLFSKSSWYIHLGVFTKKILLDPLANQKEPKISLVARLDFLPHFTFFLFYTFALLICHCCMYIDSSFIFSFVIFSVSQENL